MIQRDVIERHLQDMAAMLAELERHSGKTPDELRADQTALLAVEHALQRAIQNLLDIALHLLAGLGINDWDDYRGAILKLGQTQVIPLDFSERICDMAGTRNILVHGYIEVDAERIQEVLAHHLNDFRDFARYVVDYLEDSRGDHVEG